MYTSFSIENFRCFEDLTVEPLARVNLICGENNTGKTALLESLWLHSGPNSPDLGLRLLGFRGISAPDPRRILHDLFHNFDPEREITLTAAGALGVRELGIYMQASEAETFSIQPVEEIPGFLPGSQEPGMSAVSDSELVLEYTDENERTYVSTGRWEISRPPIPRGMPVLPLALTTQGMAINQAKIPALPTSIFQSARHRISVDEEISRVGEIELDGMADELVECLKAVDPRIQRLTTIAAPPAPMIYAHIGLSRPVPMGFLGDGVGRLLLMALAFQNARNGMILIDEIENGLHHSALRGVWENLNRLSRRFNVQVFATTHSYECMVAARDAFKSAEQKDLHIHRLNRRESGVTSTTYAFEALDYTLDYGAELR